MMIDTNSYLGTWPFSIEEPYSPQAFIRHLKANAIGQAMVSHLGAVFAPDPMPANRTLLEACKERKELVPVPIINLNLATWQEHLEECLDTAPIGAVKLLPNYHNYGLASRFIEPFMEQLSAHDLRLILNVRLNDERGQYFALKIKGLANPAIARFIRRFPESQPLITGLYRPDLKALAGECDSFLADIAFCEWEETIADLLTVLPANRLVLGTCSPLLSTRAQVDKLRWASLPARIKQQIGKTNAKRHFRL